jgi:hypothetical protein
MSVHRLSIKAKFEIAPTLLRLLWIKQTRRRPTNLLSMHDTMWASWALHSVIRHLYGVPAMKKRTMMLRLEF